MTFKLVEAASRVSGLSVDVCLEAFGEHFLLYCQKNGFDQILRVLGSNLYDFLTNLDNLHDHLASIYPGMRAPSFRVTTQLAPNGGQIRGCVSGGSGHDMTSPQQASNNHNNNSNNNACIMYLHYYSERKGLSPIVRGLVKAVAAKFFDTPIDISECPPSTCASVAGARDDHVILKIEQKLSQVASHHTNAHRASLQQSTAAAAPVRSLAVSVNGEQQQQQAETVVQLSNTMTRANNNRQTASTVNNNNNNNNDNEQQFTPTTITSTDAASKRMMITQYNISARPDELLVDCATLIDAFPFHVIFDAQFTIVQAGKTLVKMTSNFWRQHAAAAAAAAAAQHSLDEYEHDKCTTSMEQVKFYDLFSIVRPKIDRESFESIIDHSNQVFVCKTRPRTLNTDCADLMTDDGDDLDDAVHHQHVARCPITGATSATSPLCASHSSSGCRARGGHHDDDDDDDQQQLQDRQQQDRQADSGKQRPRLRLKGQMIMLGEGQFCLYLCSPRVEHLEQLAHYGLCLSDVAPHDRARDLVLMSHAHAGGRELVKQLDKTSNDLRIMDAKLRQENERTNEILRNIFPAKIANMLSEGLKVESESFAEVTCLYSDIVGFTKMCGATNVRPIDIVRLLNGLYLDFDNLTNVHGVYKVETIGDAYVVVGGLPEPNRDHADRCVRMALDMVRVIGSVRSPADQQPIQMRIGIHTGPVMAGIVGMRVPRYSLFGNTTTIANRLESTGCGGKIHISFETYRKLIDKSAYIFEENFRISENQLNLERTYFIVGTRHSQQQQKPATTTLGDK
ncbi:Guanylate cyclase soluble subunit beta-2 [Fragariocoptes setiger]|uniref:guanylate cyclase n=1 Tax=Fragariocoptes setiger TaxID=1670756 RepID=A0ABQ7S4Z7_9ACAR|nr:Guanylate cyclase soluble subunit beta-2 [Fragariocoptes setiger]